MQILGDATTLPWLFYHRHYAKTSTLDHKSIFGLVQKIRALQGKVSILCFQSFSHNLHRLGLKVQLKVHIKYQTFITILLFFTFASGTICNYLCLWCKYLRAVCNTQNGKLLLRGDLIEASDSLLLVSVVDFSLVTQEPLFLISGTTYRPKDAIFSAFHIG